MTEESISLHVAIDPNLQQGLEVPVLGWGDFVPLHPGAVVYDGTVGSLSRFYTDLVLGRPLPLQFVTRDLKNLPALVAVMLFMDRDLALLPLTTGLVSEVELAAFLGASGLAHVDRDRARLFVFLETYLQTEEKSKLEVGNKLSTAVGWVRDCLREGKLPSLPVEQDPPKVLDTGTNGFVLAEAPPRASLFLAMVELYRRGFLRGVLFGSGRQVVAFKKSPHLHFDLKLASEKLGQLEPGWTLEAGGLALRSPSQGTALSPEILTGLFLRV